MKTIDRLSKLTRIKLSKKENERFSKELMGIVHRTYIFQNFLSKNKKLKGEQEPSRSEISLRKDKSNRPITQKEALSNAKDSEEGYFKSISSLRNI